MTTNKISGVGGQCAAAIALCCLLVSLAACGQRGPLYLPEEQAAEPASQQESEKQDEENDEETPGT